jgi:hypothetical protein
MRKTFAFLICGFIFAFIVRYSIAILKMINIDLRSLPIWLLAPPAAAVALSAVVVLQSLCVGVASFFHPAPGPFLARFTSLWYVNQLTRHDWHKTVIQLHRKYGKLRPAE